jgi:hypothetical protein
MRTYGFALRPTAELSPLQQRVRDGWLGGDPE